jgi:hypothetical protein
MGDAPQGSATQQSNRNSTQDYLDPKLPIVLTDHAASQNWNRKHAKQRICDPKSIDDTNCSKAP